VENDVPVINEVSDAFIANEGGLTLVGNIDVTSGADDSTYADLSKNVSGWNGTSITSAATELTSGGNTVYYYVDPEQTDVLVATTDSTGQDGSKEVFNLTVDPENGEYAIQTFAPLDSQKEFNFDLTNTSFPGGPTGQYLITDANDAYFDIADVPSSENVVLSFTTKSTQLDEPDPDLPQGSNIGIGLNDQWIENTESSLVIDFGTPSWDPSIDEYETPDQLATGGEISIGFDIKSQKTVNIQYTLYDENGDAVGTFDQAFTGKGDTLVITEYDKVSAVELNTILNPEADPESQGAYGAFRVNSVEFSTSSDDTDIVEEFVVDVYDADGDMTSATISVEFDGDNIMGGQDYEGALSNVGPDVMVGGAENETFDGGAGDDLIIGGDGADIIEGGADNDILVADIVDFDGTDDQGSEPDIQEDGDADEIDGGDGIDILIETDADEIGPNGEPSAPESAPIENVEHIVEEGEVVDMGGEDIDPLTYLIPPPEDAS
jgi:hypothetical protein